MLKLRPNCECCNQDLPPQSEEALICSFECTAKFPASTERVFKPQGCARP
jgi:hypothetical protein